MADNTNCDHGFISDATKEHLYGAQYPAIASMVRYIESRAPEDVRGYVVLPTGAGKTVLFTRLLEDMHQQAIPSHTLVIVPTRQLVDQTKKSLVEHGFTGQIKVLDGRVKDSPLADLSIATTAGFTSYLAQNNGWGVNPEYYDIVIFDEAHHLQGESSQRRLAEHFQHAMWLGFTATPDYDTHRQLAHILPDKICEITKREAINEGLIAPFTTVELTTNTDATSVKVQHTDYNQKDLERVLNVSERNMLVARFCADTLGPTKTLYNCSRIQHVEDMAEALRLHGITAATVHGKLNKHEIQARIEAFRSGKISAVVQCSILGEGFDDPTIEAVVNVSPTRSLVRATQRVGRGQRVDPANPEKCMIVIECLDKNYQALPLLFSSPDIGGGPSVLPNGLPETASNKIGTLLGSRVNGFHVSVDPDIELSVDPQVPMMQDVTYKALSETNFYVPHTKKTRPGMVRRKFKTLEDYERHQSRRDVKEDQLDESEEMQAFKAAVVDYNEMMNPKTSDDFIAKQRDASVVEVAEYIFATTMPDDNEAAIASRLIQGSARAVRVALSQILTNKHLAQQVNQKHVSMLQVALNNRATQMDLAASSDRHPGAGMLQVLTDATIEYRPEWSAQGQCNGIEPGLFFPPRGASVSEAKAVCATCSVATLCLEFALENGEKFGIWGGRSERERRVIRRRRSMAASSKKDLI